MLDLGKKLVWSFQMIFTPSCVYKETTNKEDEGFLQFGTTLSLISNLHGICHVDPTFKIIESLFP